MFYLQLSTCIYLIFPSHAQGAFCIPPKPGLLAFLQRLHHLDLHARATMYLYHTQSHMNMARSAGVQHIKASVCVEGCTVDSYYKDRLHERKYRYIWTVKCRLSKLAAVVGKLVQHLQNQYVVNHSSQ